jgi:hypothetical protein
VDVASSTTAEAFTAEFANSLPDFHLLRLRPESAGSGEVRRLIRRQVHCRFEMIGVPAP